jgi:hypothetical protein
MHLYVYTLILVDLEYGLYEALFPKYECLNIFKTFNIC